MADIDDAEMFAEDLLIFVMNQTVSSRMSTCRNLRPCCPSSPLTTSIQFAVRRYLEDHDEAIRNIFNSLLGHGDFDKTFPGYAGAMSTLVCVRGFRGREFVAFAAVLCKLSVIGYVNNFKTCLTHSVTAVVDTIKIYRSTGAFTKESWAEMNRDALLTITTPESAGL